MDRPVYHLSIEIWENSLKEGHDHENDHDELVSLYGYVTGIHAAHKYIFS